MSVVPAKKQIPFWEDCLMQIAAGGSAGFVEICITHPLDVVKTRFQFQTATSAIKYTSIADCFGKTIKNEGFFAIYKGILPPILAETPKRAIKFFTFEQYRQLFTFGSKSSTSSLVLAGASAGLTEAFFVNPFEVVKVRLQTDQSHVSNQKGTFEIAKSIYKENGFGLNGLNRGLTSTLGRHGIWSGIYFGFYHSTKVYIPKTDNKVAEYGYRSLAGFTAGSIASVANIPWDVAKSRIQGYHPDESKRRYRTCLQTMLLVYREEGFKALYKGLLPKLLRLGPGGAIMMIAYEEIYAFEK
jgi:solute carrier family 25 2-oxodicarboxylate transporter 21